MQWKEGIRFMSTVNSSNKEDIEQTYLFRWAVFASGKYPELDLMFHIPNGGLRSKTEAARMKAQGVKAGMPDICLPVAKGKYHALYIELKREKGGTVSANQKIKISQLIHAGNYVAVCKGWESAMTIIAEYLQLKDGGMMSDEGTSNTED